MRAYLPRMVPMVYHADYVTPLPAGHRFPMEKFGFLAQVVTAEGLAPGGLVQPVKPDLAVIKRVHAPGYVDAFVNGTLGHEAQRRIGLPWSPGLVHRSVVAVGGTLLTVELALRDGLACNLAGGTHHAHAGFGSGFCIFNDMAIATRHALDAGWVDQVLIVDLDVHQGDGTATIFENDPRVFTFSMHCGKNFPARKAQSDLDVELPEGMQDAEYLELLMQGEDGAFAGGLAGLLERVEPDLVIFDAGVDVHAADKLGKLRMSDAGLLERDRFVIECSRSMGVPVACVIGGGYADDRRLLAHRHATVHRAAVLATDGHR